MLGLTRAFQRASAKTIGNFWVDVTRSTLYVLMPLSALMAIVLVSQGVVQSFKPYGGASLLEPYTAPPGNKKVETQDFHWDQPPRKSPSNSSAPTAADSSAQQCSSFREPDTIDEFYQMLAILLLPGALVCSFG